MVAHRFLCARPTRHNKGEEVRRDTRVFASANNVVMEMRSRRIIDDAISEESIQQVIGWDFLERFMGQT